MSYRLLSELNRLKLSLSDSVSAATPLLYLFKHDFQDSLTVEVRQPSIRKNGKFGLGKLTSASSLKYQTELTAEDQDVIDLWQMGSRQPFFDGLPENADFCASLLKKLISTGRCYWWHPNNPPLKFGQECSARLEWIEQVDTRQKLQLTVDGESKFVFLSPCLCYVDTKTHEWGELLAPISHNALKSALRLPSIGTEEVEALRYWLNQNAPQIPAPKTMSRIERRSLKPKPQLLLETRQLSVPLPDGKLMETAFDLAAVSFEYPEYVTDPKEHKRVFLEGDARIIETCQTNLENQAIEQLTSLGFEQLYNPSAYGLTGGATYLRATDPSAWYRLLTSGDQFEEENWVVATSPTFRTQIVEADDEWDSEVEQGSSWWLSLNMGIFVNGERVPLLPLLRKGFASLPGEPTIEDIESLSTNGKFVVSMPDGRILTLPFERVKPIFETLFELLLDRNSLSDKIDISIAHLSRLMNLERLVWLGTSRLLEIAKRLSAFSGIVPAQPPASFAAQLRNYQQDGLSWLQFLREYNLGGILADDMGLGKTVQALAHILLEKTSGRMQAPFLVVCPTSVLPNWMNEAQRFAPDLKVLALHGARRRHYFSRISEADVVLSTYPLLLRDTSTLTMVSWHGVILDEAQAIKSSKTQTASITFKLKADHKVCMTGTPIENHLGELWSQFTFLMPGMLGSKQSFKDKFRDPIEKENDKPLLKLLSSLLAPFILRRTKMEVAPELPEKTTIIQRVRLDGAQRDLYETVRLAMLKSVREEIAVKGIAQSSVIILEALLRLRQVCCDTRLLKVKAAKGIKESAKLVALMEMVPELLKGGRRIILFSQFTSMLDLIKVELAALNIPFVELRGDTQDRVTPVTQFQKEEVPLFLISLKAGGTGLNLTAADTVIHYDPWWNPAVENQATDRAHRIGQTKKVFVYKLIASGTVEERMLELQDRKRDLADALFDSEKSPSIKFTEEDLDLLFKPLGP